MAKKKDLNSSEINPIDELLGPDESEKKTEEKKEEKFEEHAKKIDEVTKKKELRYKLFQSKKNIFVFLVEILLVVYFILSLYGVVPIF